MAKARKDRPGSGGRATSEVAGAPAAAFDGRVVKVVLEVVGVSQKDLAPRVGMSRERLGRIARGQAPLTAETAAKLARALGLPPYVFGDARDFLLQMDRLRRVDAAWRSPSGADDSGGESEEHDVAEGELRAADLDRMIEDSRVVDAAARTFRDLLLWFLHRTGAPPSPGP